jgi:hypothetical protein
MLQQAYFMIYAVQKRSDDGIPVSIPYDTKIFTIYI